MTGTDETPIAATEKAALLEALRIGAHVTHKAFFATGSGAGRTAAGLSVRPSCSYCGSVEL
jgi:hypothetical protein